MTTIYRSYSVEDKQTKFKMDIGDGIDRYFKLVREDHMFCEFTNTGEEEVLGWCTWNRDDNGVWFVGDSSRGTGKAVAKYAFNDKLDEIHLQLLAEKELL